MSQKRLFWLSDSPLLQTGYANISRQICNRLAAKGWEVHYLGAQFPMQPLLPGVTFEDGDKCSFKIYGINKELYGKDILQERIREIKPQVFVTLLDTFMVFPWFTEVDFSPARSVFYFPSDGGEGGGGGLGLPTQCEHILRRMSTPVAMSKFAQKQVKELYNIDALYIPHAVDSSVYKPLNAEEKMRARARWGLQDKFVVGVVARQQPRKMLERGILAFAQFCRDKPDAVFFMHTDPFDSAASFNILRLIERLGIQNRVVFSGMKASKGFAYSEMNDVYNVMDVFFLSTSGEGWGVPTTEAMSAGIPVVITDYTTTKEIVTDHQAGIAVRPAAEIMGSWEVDRAIMDITDAVHALNLMYCDEGLRKRCGENGRKAVLAEYDWDVVASEWDRILSGMVEW